MLKGCVCVCNRHLLRRENVDKKENESTTTRKKININKLYPLIFIYVFHTVVVVVFVCTNRNDSNKTKYKTKAMLIRIVLFNTAKALRKVSWVSVITPAAATSVISIKCTCTWVRVCNNSLFCARVCDTSQGLTYSLIPLILFTSSTGLKTYPS